MARARRWLALFASLLLSACYFSVDWDGLAGSSGAPNDGGSDAAAIDAAADSSDAADASDAASEACPDGGFCDDFERTTVLGPWNDITSVAGTLSITNHAYTGEGALRTSLDGSQGARALVEKSFPASTSMRLRYHYFESTATLVHGITPITFNYSDRADLLILGFNGDVVVLYEQEFGADGKQTYFNQYNTFPRLTNQWVEVIIDVTLGSTGHVKLSYGGVVVTDTNLARTYGATEPSVGIGENYGIAGDPGSFDIDDVQVSWTPTN